MRVRWYKWMNFSMNWSRPAIVHNEEGFVLVLAMMIMVVVTLLGLAATTTSVFEINIAGNEKWSQEQFFQADSGINEFLARGIRPNHPGELAYNPLSPPAGVPTATPTTCSVLQGNPYHVLRIYDPDNLPGTGLVNLFYLRRVSGAGSSGPQIVEIMACAQRGNTVASLTAGIEVGLPPGAIPGLNKVGYNP